MSRALFERELLAHHDAFRAFVRRRVKSDALADEILQGALAHALARVDAIRSEASAIAWFYRLLRNAIADHFRRLEIEARAFEAVQRVDAMDVRGSEPRGEICRCLVPLVDALKPEYAAAIRAIDLGGESVKHFAREAGISANNAHVRIHRARRALRSELLGTCGACARQGCTACRCRPRSIRPTRMLQQESHR